MVCCAGDTSPAPTSPVRPPIPGVTNPFHPQITMRPPWAIWSTPRPPTQPPPTTTWTTTTTTTTTTTPRPQTHRTTPTNLYPNWPPPFITHPPSHFPSWVHNTFATQGTTTTPTTMRPSHHWPPYPYPTAQPEHRPPQMTTPPSSPSAPVSSSCGASKIVGGTQAAKAEFREIFIILE